MELKHFFLAVQVFRRQLLIVPCGIETCRRRCSSRHPHPLLIVPCGIETEHAHFYFRPSGLLIVPCGIETRTGRGCRYEHRRLLIVPCGIETSKGRDELYLYIPFNRTLWN